MRFILPSLSRRCLAHRVGTHSPRLHFCREPNLASGRREPLYCRRVGFVPLGNHTLTPSSSVTQLFHMSCNKVALLWFEPSRQAHGAKEWNRTTDLPLMRRTFLPTELLGHRKGKERKGMAPHVSIGATAGSGLLLSLSKPSAQLISEGDI